MIRSRRKRKVEKIDLERGSNCVKAISAPDTLMMFPSRRDCQLVLWRMIMIMRNNHDDDDHGDNYEDDHGGFKQLNHLA